MGQTSIRNRLDIVELLVTHGANVNHQNKTGYTALFTATLEAAYR